MPKSLDPHNHATRIHIAAQLRTARNTRALSQEQLADKVGLTFQQVQKYEKATNRISADRLFQIAGVLQVPPAYFFDGLDQGEAKPITPVSANELELLAAFRAMPAPTRAAWLNIMRQAAANFAPADAPEAKAA